MINAAVVAAIVAVKVRSPRAIADEGVTFVVKASDEYELLAKNPLGEKVFASPAFSDGDIFLRGAKHLWCIGRK